MIKAEDWYETIRMSDNITLIHEPWIKPFFRCNMWHVRGRDRDLLFDSGLGHFSLKNHVKLVTERELTCVASHTHFDHIGCHHEFGKCAVHADEVEILVNPRNELTAADRYANEDMFDAIPEGWNTKAYHVKSAELGRALQHGDIIDLGNRAFEVIHTPGHSPGGIGLFERQTGIFLSGDVIYDAYHSNVMDYLGSMENLKSLPVNIVHGGHFPSFGKVRFRQLIDEYVEGKRKLGCHLAT